MVPVMPNLCFGISNANLIIYAIEIPALCFIASDCALSLMIAPHRYIR